MSVHGPHTDEAGARFYVVRWREGSGDTARQRSRRFALKSEADAWDAEVKRRKRLGPVAVAQLTQKGPTLGDWITNHWAPEHGVNLASKTRWRYANSYEVHIEPWLGHLPLQELTVGRLREWQAARLGKGATPHAIMKARTVLGSVLRHAAESEAIAGNPLQLVRPPKLPHKDDVVPLSPRVVELLRAGLGQRDATIVSVLAYSGMRPSELRALRWGDIAKTINVQRAASPEGEIKDTKTRRGRRRIRLLAALAEDLAAWKTASHGRGRGLVFPRPDGDAMTETDWNNWRSDVWRPLWTAPELDLVELGLYERPRPYDLRHSFASLLLAEHRTVHQVAEQLGHDAALTLSTYGHVIAEYADRTDDIDADQEIAAARAAQQQRPAPRPPRRERASDRNRTRVAGALTAAGQTVEQLVAATGMKRPTVSRHLRALEKTGEARRARGAGRNAPDQWSTP